MIRYTTASLGLRVKGADLTGAKVWVTLRQETSTKVNRYETEIGYVTLTIDDPTITIVEQDTYVGVELSQDQSGMFDVSSGKPLYVQVNWMTDDGKRKATRIKPVENLENLLQEVLSYE